MTLTYATGRGHALIGRKLYLPEGCAADEEHRELAGVPEKLMFATKPRLTGTLLDRVTLLGSGLPLWPAMRMVGVSWAAASGRAE